MIEIQHISKRFGGKPVLNDVSFIAEDGKVTGFLGPNGAGKSTTMRAALGLVTPDCGQALIDGQPYAHLKAPMAAVGAVLDAKSAHKGRSAYAHLKALAQTNGIPASRVDEVMDLTGIASVKKRRAGAFSLGMSQRLSIAAALLGDPRNLVLDEPINGLDPEGVKWVRELCRFYASQGRAVLLSSHLMSEVALTADNLVIIGQGRILETTSVAAFVAEHSGHSLRVATAEPDKLHAIFASAPQVTVAPAERKPSDPPIGEVFRITGADLEATARVFAQAQLITYEFVEEHASLEDAYMTLTHSQVEYTNRKVPGQQAIQYGEPGGTPSAPVAPAPAPNVPSAPIAPIAPNVPSAPIAPAAANPAVPPAAPQSVDGTPKEATR